MHKLTLFKLNTLYNMDRLREVLAFVNHKGGVGKTTTVQSLAAGLRRFGKGSFGEDADGHHRLPRVLIIDLDPQACASFLFGWSETQNVGKIGRASCRERV